MNEPRIDPTPQVVPPFVLNGNGWWSPELAQLCADFNRAEITEACKTLDIDARRTNVARLRQYLEAGEATLK